ncbi:MAG: hypothetical protein AAGU76_16435 [Sedimentibacter sp.]|uniref:hypothetical protein n=1 Tax=Sedimentibacter sp. TaxID=1960295 RepID=UPI0031587800
MKKSVILILTAAIALTAGCTADLKVDENAVKEVSDKITEKIIDTVGKEGYERYETHTFDAEGISRLTVSSAVGKINVKTHDSAEAVVNITVRVKSSSKEKSKEIADSYSYTAEKNGSSIDVDTSIKDYYPDGTSIDTDIEVLLPSGISDTVVSLNVGDIDIAGLDGSIEASCNVGSISIKDCSGYYNMRTDVGNIDLADSSAQRNSDFTVNTGDIDLSFSDIASADTISVKTNVGDIDVKIPENPGYKSSIKEFMKDEQTETSGDGKTKITLSSGVGTAKLN